MNRFMSMIRSLSSRALPLLALTLAACEGDNLYQSLPTQSGGGRSDPSAPTVTIEAPDSSRRVAVGDSVLVRVRVSDNQALGALQLSGFAVRGSAELGTETRVERFASKVVEFDSIRAVRDTVISRYLVASADTLPDPAVFLVATVRDTSGNARSDTVRVAIGGPRAQILSPATLTDVRAGTPLRVRISASDPARLDEVAVRASGGATLETTLRLEYSTARVDTVLVLQIPPTAEGELLVQAIARSTTNDSALSAPVRLRLLPPIRDAVPPVVRFSVSAPARGELDDSVRVTVSATDSTQIFQIGVSVLPIHRLSMRTDTLTPITLTSPEGEHTFGFPLSQVGLPEPSDTSTLRLEITAFARDTAGNCAVATVPGAPASESCRVESGRTFGNRAGARTDILAVRGSTIPLESRADVIADIASDGRSVFLSNLSRNRLEVVRVGEKRISATVSVGARPWGLAFDRSRNNLYVANSGGTNISVVSPAGLSEVRRILTPNVKLFDSAYEAKLYPNPDTAAAADSLLGYFPSSVERYDYSDRPQFIGVTQNENLVYSTLPTGAAPDGTIRIYRTSQDRLQIVTEYAENRPGGKVIIAYADSAFLVDAKPNNLIQVCPRNRSADPRLDGTLPKICVTGDILMVRDSLRRMGYDTEFQFNRDIGEVGLQDTTFVAVSGDHGTVAFGEGATENGRVMVLTDRLGSDPNEPLLKSGEIRDIVGNTAERVIGLSLNRDGSLGVARGKEAYFFNTELRLQGVVTTGQQSGGVDMHPANPEQRRTFVSGIEPSGLAYIDVIDSFHFRRIARIFMRDVVTGPVRAVPAADGTLKLYAVTAQGVVVLDVNLRDL